MGAQTTKQFSFLCFPAGNILEHFVFPSAAAVTSNLTLGTDIPLGLVMASRTSNPGGTDKAMKAFLRSAATCKRVSNLAGGKTFTGFYYFSGEKVRTLYVPKVIPPEISAHADGTDAAEGKT